MIRLPRLCLVLLSLSLVAPPAEAQHERGFVLDSSAVRASGARTLSEFLAGRVPGLAVTRPSGVRGVAAQLRMRGASGLIGAAEPVLYIDGMLVRDDQYWLGDLPEGERPRALHEARSRIREPSFEPSALAADRLAVDFENVAEGEPGALARGTGQQHEVASQRPSRERLTRLVRIETALNVVFLGDDRFEPSPVVLDVRRRPSQHIRCRWLLRGRRITSEDGGQNGEGGEGHNMRLQRAGETRPERK